MPCRSRKQFRFDDKGFGIISGQKFFKNGDINFGVDTGFARRLESLVTEDPYIRRVLANFNVFRGCVFKSGSYRTIFGPYFQSKSYQYLIDNRAISQGVRRLTGVREPERVGYHELLFANQAGFVNDRSTSEFLSWFCLRLHSICLTKRSAEYERKLWVETSVVKKQLRKNALRLLEANGRDKGLRMYRHGLNEVNVNYHIKDHELLASDKYTRAIGDLTVTGSTVGAYFATWIKEAFASVYRVGNSIAKFIPSASRDDLVEGFRLLLKPEDVSFIYFSDDSCVGVRCDDGYFYANCDISQCDGSHGAELIARFQTACRVDSRYDHDVKCIFDQLSARATVHSSDHRKKVVLVPKRPVLYSGSVLTTSINNMANVLIFLSVLKELPVRRTKAQVADVVKRAGELCGYIVKCQVCEHIEQIQFLKRSFTLVRGNIVPFINLGVVLRTIGQCVGDLPGSSKLSFEERARRYTSEVLYGYRNEGNYELLQKFIDNNVLRERFDIKIESRFFRGDYGDTVVSQEALMKRYSLSDGEYLELKELLCKSTFGTVARSRVIDKVIDHDYGYSDPKWLVESESPWTLGVVGFNTQV